MLFSSMVRFRFRIKIKIIFGIWLVSGYVYVFIVLTVVVVTPGWTATTAQVHQYSCAATSQYVAKCHVSEI